MTYGFRPKNWWSFQQELRARGIAVGEIEKVEMRPLTTAASTETVASAIITVTLRSGRVDTWIHEEAIRSRP
jgi:hypothetical protein